MKAVASDAAEHSLPVSSCHMDLNVRSTGFSLLLNHMVALINSPNTGCQRVRSAIGDEWHFSELNGEQWVSGVSCGEATYVHIRVH